MMSSSVEVRCCRGCPESWHRCAVKNHNTTQLIVHAVPPSRRNLRGVCSVFGEVRCPNLTTTLTTALSVVVEDRGRVEATADYSCEKGRRIVGNSQRKCGSNGIWSGSQPRCEYVTCDLPQGLDNGRIVRLNQTLEYGSLVEYHCLPEHRLVGGSFRRSCGELGEWLGGEPKCVLDVTCNLPQGLDNGRIVRLNQTLEYGSLVEYHCLPEHRLVGGSFRRSCGELGEWLGGEPKCVLDVTCDLPQGLDNGRIVRLNQTLEYGSLVEYHCLPEHRLVGGSFRRSCGELGEWLGGEPKCVLGPEDAYNTIGSDSSSSSVSTTSTSTASNTGLYIGLFFGLILAIVFIGVLVYFRMFWAPSRTRELTVLASGQVAKMERDTKMTYQNVSIVLSPTMQISHRVLNVFFLNRAYLFGGVAIKK
ncbi:CUB and sushi domain-containing protein 3-like [Eriocheir sinensis]|uniref:CUB and sushi domain-containing protein 3-like n=1 Tax=Eriocheir sinensis TaxID=95602 RepID=UPI0021C7C66A|nr:CUB and sushi domain-containing protein 3-like [Eriocheir sinensis]